MLTAVVEERYQDAGTSFVSFYFFTLPVFLLSEVFFFFMHDERCMTKVLLTIDVLVPANLY